MLKEGCLKCAGICARGNREGRCDDGFADLTQRGWGKAGRTVDLP